MNKHYKEFNNCKFCNHPCINFFTFEAYKINILDHICIVEQYQDDEIWSDDEYWGSICYDLDNDRYVMLCAYDLSKEDIENLVNKHGWDGKISEEFNEAEQLRSIKFYKEFIKSDEQTPDKFYKDISYIINKNN